MLNTFANLSELSSEQKDELIGKLLALLEQQNRRIAELEERLKQNSSNSSKPPSSDGFVKKTKSLRRASGKKVGGQKGHAGRSLRQTPDPDETIILDVPTRCKACGEALSEKPAAIVETRQVFDIPVRQYEVTAYCAQEVVCQCGCKNRSPFPFGVVGPTQYGPHIRAFGVYLTQQQLLPYARAAEVIESLYGLSVASASLPRWVREASHALEPTVAEIAQRIKASEVVGADESGIRVEGKLYWLHTAVTAQYTWYGVHVKRGFEALEAFEVLTGFEGILVHDCLRTYWQLDSTHALCNAHLLRELQFVMDTAEQTWASELFALLNAACKAKNEALAQQQNVPEEIRMDFEKRYLKWVAEGLSENPAVEKAQGKKGRAKQSFAHNLLCRLQAHHEAILRFLANTHVPFTNNLAEQAIRMPKVKIKIAGCFRSRSGAEDFAAYRTYSDTLRKQGISLFHALCSLFRGTVVQPL